MNNYNSFQKYVHIISPTRRCNCYEYGRTSKCMHSTCVKIMIDHIPVPPEAKTVPLGCKRKPGRPPMALGRYIVQTYDTCEGVGQLDGDDPGPESPHKIDLKRKKQKTSSSTAAKSYDDQDEHYEDEEYYSYSGADDDADNRLDEQVSKSAVSGAQHPSITAYDSTQRGQVSKSAVSGAHHPSTTAYDSTQRGQVSKSAISGAHHSSTTAYDSTQRGQVSKSVNSGAHHPSTTSDENHMIEDESLVDYLSEDFDSSSEDGYQEEYI